MPAYTHRILVLLFLFLGAPALLAETVYDDNLHLDCKKSEGIGRFNCSYRLIAPETIVDINAVSATHTLPLERREYPGDDDSTAILILVDTSDPARADVVAKNSAQAGRLIAKAEPHQQLALARFDKGLTLLAPFNADKSTLSQAAENLHATGKVTELYRSLLDAIKLLDATEARRKSIYLFSDGLAEDKAYFHDDVIKAANAAGVIITGLGFPRSTSLSVALQNIRRLSEETGGRYLESDNQYRLPDDFFTDPFATIENGGVLTLDISRLLPAATAVLPVSIHVETGTGSRQATINLPAPAPVATQSPATTGRAAAGSTATSQPAPAPPVQIITRDADVTAADKWFWYGIPLALIVLLLLTVGFLMLSSIRQTRESARHLVQNEFKPYAYLVVQDESKKRYAITRTTWRIGRGNDNEMTLNDSSVSRRHAEIHRDQGDMFTIFDLDSLNGVYINNNKVSKSLLHEGDIIEIGDIHLRFTLLSTDFSVEESTVMQNTRAPITH